MRNHNQIKPGRKTEIALWTVQVLLAALFLFAGAMKLISPADVLSAQSPLPVGFLRFIGAAEALGALGLVLPGLFRIRVGLTALAAVGLTIIMAGAVVLSVPMGVVATAIPLLVGAACSFVAYRRNPARGARRSIASAAA